MIDPKADDWPVRVLVDGTDELQKPARAPQRIESVGNRGGGGIFIGHECLPASRRPKLDGAESVRYSGEGIDHRPDQLPRRTLAHGERLIASLRDLPEEAQEVASHGRESRRTSDG